ncbi:MAG: response regulator, partial [Gammaproteobacteria bacterium]|nr:response regulator [Gammaproteobacteria bacterium]
ESLTHAAEQRPSPASITGHNILVAEDNPTNQTLILSQLEALGYAADLAKNGQEALNMMVNTDYQLLLTDCNMPLVDGYKLASTIRERGNQQLPIIALTADAFPEKKTECFKAGMNDHITKPADLQTLKDTLEKYLN